LNKNGDPLGAFLTMSQDVLISGKKLPAIRKQDEPLGIGFFVSASIRHFLHIFIGATGLYSLK
jgi:hypothetical protein